MAIAEMTLLFIVRLLDESRGRPFERPEAGLSRYYTIGTARVNGENE